MKIQKALRAHVLLFFSLMTFIWCSGQNTPKSENTSMDSGYLVGDTVEKLGKSLWYVFQDKSNNYWFGSNGEGIFRYDGKSIQNFTTKHGLCSDSIRQIQEDKFGNLYFSTLGGINKFDGKQMIKLEAIKSSEWKSEQNDLWFYMLGKKDEHGPYRYDGENLYNLEFPKHYLHDEFHTNGINPFFSPYEIYSIYKDRKGAIWFGTSVFGACRYDGNAIKWMYEKDLTIVPNGGSFGIRSIYEDKDGRFWICNTQQRFRFNYKKTEKKDRLQYKKKSGIGNARNFDGDDYIYFSHIVEDKNRNIWLTTWDQGVYKYDGKNITNYSVKDGVKNTHLVSMYIDNDGELWLGTPENGTFKLNGETFEPFNP